MLYVPPGIGADQWGVSESGEHTPLLRSTDSCDLNTSVNAAGSKRTEGDAPKGTSWYVASLIVINAALGAGLLNFPFAFNRAGGIVVAMIVQGVFIILATFSLLILAYCSDIRKCYTYQETVKSLCGKWLGVLCSIAIAVYCYFTCVTFLIIVGDQTDRIFADAEGHRFCQKWYMNRRFVVSALAAALIWPLCYSKRIDFLKHASAVATAGVIYLIVLIIVNFYTEKVDVVINTKPDVWSDVFLVVPSICFGYQCHVSVIPVYSCLQPRVLKSFIKTAFLAMFACLFAYSLVGIYGYLTYGTDVRADLWSSMNTKQPWVLAGLLAFGLKIFLTYPILQFCGRAAVESVWLEIKGPFWDDRSEFRFRTVVATTWFISSVFLTIVIPDISAVIGALGSLAAVFIFVFPGLCLIETMFIFESSLSAKLRNVGFLVGAVYIVIGSFIFGTVLTQDLRTLPAKGTHELALCY